MGLIDSALDLRDSEIALASHFSRRGLAREDAHDHGGLALRGPSFDGVVVAHPVLLMTALYPVQLWRGGTSLGRSCGDLTTKLDLICDRYEWPLTFTLSPGQDADTCRLMPTMETIRLPGKAGGPRKRCHHVVADKGYYSYDLRRYCDRDGTKPIIPQRKMYRKPRPGLPQRFDKPKYRERNVVERTFS